MLDLAILMLGVVVASVVGLVGLVLTLIKSRRYLGLSIFAAAVGMLGTLLSR